MKTLTESLVLGMQKVGEMKQTTNAVVKLILDNLTAEELDRAIHRGGGVIQLDGRRIPKEEDIYTGWYIDHLDDQNEAAGYGVQYAEGEEQLLKRQNASEQLSIPAAHAVKIFQALPGFVIGMMQDFPQLRQRLKSYFEATGCSPDNFVL
ncbi:MAG: hypothetical protein KGI41_01120 [Patescibacteria group bacterium]|nr:hypothetical protein [Patescibacteria group bacterium]